MGGDKAPEQIVAGAREAAGRGIAVLLVGDPGVLADHDTGGLEIVPAAEVIGMDEDPATAVRRKRDSSVVRCAELVRDGEAAAMVSAGNTGAAMVSALLRLGRLPGVARPAIATTLPVPGSVPTVLVDSGANAECTAGWLLQFGQMGAAFAGRRFGIAEPRVGLLSIGEEETKGSPLVKEAHGLLAGPEALAGAGARFIGNVEGHDVLTDRVDVVVTDGFTGNVVLKTLEGGVKVLVDAIVAVMGSTEETQKASEVLIPALLPLYREMDAETYGGAMLLGVAGVCVIAHGSSSSRAIVNAVTVAAELAAADLVGHVAAAVGALGRPRT